MNNNSGKRLRNAGLILTAIALGYLAVWNMGLSEFELQQNDLEQCKKMMELWEVTEGEFGWPQGTCDAI
jgi:hypothetical protein